jgi:hypothetical protein
LLADPSRLARRAPVGLTFAVAGRSAARGSRLLAVIALLVITACGGSKGGSANDIFGRRPNGGTGGTDAGASAGVMLTAPAGTATATLDAAAAVVRARLVRMGVANPTVATRPDGIQITAAADAYQLRAAAQHHATTIAPVTATALGPCTGAGSPSAPPALRCFTLGPARTGVGALTSIAVGSSGAGWKTTFAVESNQYAAFRAALEPSGAELFAVVADGVVVVTFAAGVPALESAIGPPLAEEQARRGAAALAVDSDLPVELQAPAVPASPGARVGIDFWTAALGVEICGTWLANAPSSGLDTGVHSHGDGLVYVHPFTSDEAGDRATLGLFLKRGGYQVSADELRLWDGVKHRSGTACPDGSTGRVRWWVDGVEQHGDPSSLTPRNGQVIVLGFDGGAGSPGPPPQMSALYVPPIGAAS